MGPGFKRWVESCPLWSHWQKFLVPPTRSLCLKELQQSNVPCLWPASLTGEPGTAWSGGILQGAPSYVGQAEVQSAQCPEASLKHPVSIYYNPSLFPPSLESPYVTAVNSHEPQGVWTQLNGLQAEFAVLKLEKKEKFHRNRAKWIWKLWKREKRYQPLGMRMFSYIFAHLCFW